MVVKVEEGMDGNDSIVKMEVNMRGEREQKRKGDIGQQMQLQHSVTGCMD